MAHKALQPETSKLLVQRASDGWPHSLIERHHSMPNLLVNKSLARIKKDRKEGARAESYGVGWFVVRVKAR